VSTTEPPGKPFRVGLLGHGTVGSAFAELLPRQADRIARITGLRPVLSGVVTRSNGESFEELLEDSDLIVELMGVASGVLKGKSAIRPCWERGLAAHPGLQFELHCVLIGVDSIAIYYRSTPKSRMVAEVLKFGDDGQIVSGSALYA